MPAVAQMAANLHHSFHGTARTNRYRANACAQNADFDAHPQKLRRLPETLSVQNRNLSSQTALAWGRPTITRAELVATYGRYRKVYAAAELPRDVRWAEPYVAMLAELMKEIRFR